jgi:hypothetical protein
LIGFVLFTAVIVGWAVAAWRLVRAAAPGTWQRSQGLLALATVIAYVSSALFHDLTLSPTDHWPLFLMAGVTVGLLAQCRSSVVKVNPQTVARSANLGLTAT